MDACADTENLDTSVAAVEELDVSGSGKRHTEVEDGGDLTGCSPRKKARGDFDTVRRMRRVAEIVLVLSSMSKMRGGREPTAAEVEMMAEARAKVAELCVELAPQDIIPKSAIEAVVEDLGLSKVSDQGLGLRLPRMSISERMLLTNKKMEPPKGVNAHSVTYKPQQLHSNIGLMSENHTLSQNGHVISSEKQGLSSISFNYSPAASVSTSLLQNVSLDGVKSSAVSSQSAKTPLAFNRSERPHFNQEGRLAGSFTSQVSGNPSNMHSLVKPAMLSKSTASVKSSPENKPLNKKSESSEAVTGKGMTFEAQTGREQPSRTYSVQATSGNFLHQPLQSVYVHIPSSFNTHVEISRYVQNFLQTKTYDQCPWTPHSKEYMNNALMCQICKVTVNEVESIIVCDACEKGFHLKCIQFKGIHGAEWHCPRCMAVSNGKPLPPKYGPVFRNIAQTKVSQGGDGAQSSEKIMLELSQKGSQNKINSSGDSDVKGPSISASTDSVCAELVSEIRRSNELGTSSAANEVLHTGTSDKLDHTDQSGERHTFHVPNDSLVTDGGFGSIPNSQTPAKVGNTVSESTQKEQKVRHASEQDTFDSNENEPMKNPSNNVTGEYVSSTSKSERFDCESVCDPSRIGSTANDLQTDSTTNSTLTSDGLQQVEWVSDAIKVVDGKFFFERCCVGGIVYKVLDHALLRSSNDKLIPSKIQAMWEDEKTKLKWISVDRCFFPADLPPAVGHPCGPESNEVYESNHNSAVMAGLVQGRCEVLPSNKFEVELERRTRMGSVTAEKLGPLFICKWSYDETRRLFRPIMG